MLGYCFLLMTNDSNPVMNGHLTIADYSKTKPGSVKELIVTSLRIFNTFTKLTCVKTVDEIISKVLRDAR